MPYLTWICHGCTRVPHPEPPFHLPPHPIPLGLPSAPALSTLSHALNLNWRSVSHMIIYMFQCYSLRSSHPGLLPQSPKDSSVHLCLFCCLAYIVIVAIFINSIYTEKDKLFQIPFSSKHAQHRHSYTHTHTHTHTYNPSSEAKLKTQAELSLFLKVLTSWTSLLWTESLSFPHARAPPRKALIPFG